MANRAFDLAEGTAILERTPKILWAWLDGLPPAWTGTNEGPESWNAFDVLGHLIHGEKTDWIPRAEHILAGRGDAPFPPFDRFAQLEGTHPDLGRVRLGQHLATWVAHDLSHLTQIARVMAFQWTAAVGPWRKYLRILNP